MKKASLEKKYCSEDFVIMQVDKEFIEYVDEKLAEWRQNNWIYNNKQVFTIEEALSANITHEASKRGEYLQMCKIYDEWKEMKRETFLKRGFALP